MRKMVINIFLFLFVFTIFFCIPAQLEQNDDIYTYIYDWGDSGSEWGEFNNPGSIFIYIPNESNIKSGSVFVTDTFNHRIQVFDLEGNFIRTWGEEGTGEGQFKYPKGIYVSSADEKSTSGSVFVTDTFNHRVQVFDLEGNFVRTWGEEGTGEGQFNKPGDIFIGKDFRFKGRGSSGSVFVTDTFNKRVQIFDLDGDFEGNIGEEGTGEGQLNQPSGIFVVSSELTKARGSGGSVFVTDTFNSKVQVYDYDGNFVRSFGEEKLNQPQGIYIDSDENVFIADSGNHKIYVFDMDGDFITSFGSYGDQKGQFESPADIYGDGNGSIYILDTGNDRIQKFVKTDIIKSHVTPASDSMITVFEPVVITFNKAINTNTLSINGTLLDTSHNEVWQTIINPNDKLIIEPQNYWNEATGKTLNITCSDFTSNMIKINLVFDTENAVYVSNTTGDDSNPGTKKQAIQKITTAINKLANKSLTGNIYIGKGTYNIDYQASTHIIVSEGISLYGAYDFASWTRDIANYQTIIIDTSTGGGVLGNPSAVIIADVSITNTTIIDGLTINGSTAGGSYTSGIFCNGGSPTISNNIIDGGNGTTRNYGIYNKSSTSTIIQNNHIDGGNGNLLTYGIYNQNAVAKIYNNTIFGGEISGSVYGIFCDNSTGVTIRNNTISGGNPSGGGSNSYSINLTNSPSSLIDNNIIFTTGGTNRYGIHEFDASSDPSSVKNNDIFDCLTALYMNDGTTMETTIAGVNAIAPYVDSNVDDDLVDGADTYFVDEATDWHLTSSVPVSVTQGGLDGSPAGLNWDYSIDKDENTRTGDTATGWSMGAYERD